MKILFMILIILLAFFVFIFTALCPDFPEKKEAQAFLHHLFAHRGLFTKDQSIPENSMAAFANAVEHGYGIELDIQLTKDKQLVVFHDHTLTRMCGIDLPVCEMTYEELQKYTLGNTEEKIPLFKDVLELVDGKVPLLVEIKLPTLRTYTCQAADALLQNYRGQYCIESFNPLALRWYKNTAKT